MLWCNLPATLRIDFAMSSDREFTYVFDPPWCSGTIGVLHLIYIGVLGFSTNLEGPWCPWLEGPSGFPTHLERPRREKQILMILRKPLCMESTNKTWRACNWCILNAWQIFKIYHSAPHNVNRSTGGDHVFIKIKVVICTFLRRRNLKFLMLRTRSEWFIHGIWVTESLLLQWTDSPKMCKWKIADEEPWAR